MDVQVHHLIVIVLTVYVKSNHAVQLKPIVVLLFKN